MGAVVPPGARRVTQQGSSFYVVGEQRALLRDAYHTFLRMPWVVSLGAIALGFFVANLVFAAIYVVVGGVGGADGSFVDALSFSVQTMATIGYGVMHPSSGGATAVMIVESMVGMIVTALATGLVFAKFSRPTTRVAFSKYVVFTQHEGKRTMIFRVGNRRGNVIVEAQLHVVAVITTVTAEGKTFYKANDLKLLRDRQVGMTRGWTVMHVIDETSPLYGLDTQAALKRAEVEIYIALTGIDDITMQQVHTMHTYTELTDFALDHHFADTLVPLDNGEFMVDVSKFDTIVPDADARDSVRAS
jgi:inward rectifier potassium channel